MSIRICKDGFLQRNTLLWVAPYLLFLIVFNLFLAWGLIDLTGLGWVPPLALPLDAAFFRGDMPGRWIAVPAAVLALVEHGVLALPVEVGE